jgi:hypothetical protein
VKNPRVTTRPKAVRGDRTPFRPLSRLALALLLTLTLVAGAVWLQACNNTDDPGTETTASTLEGSSQSGNVEGVIGESTAVGHAVVLVRALQSTFQPAMPSQRLSESTPSAPGVGESFYQAYVRVENKAVGDQRSPIRVDPQDFMCRIGDKVVGIEPTRSGPYARSLLENTSLDLLLTFEGPAGFQPELLYDPPWYDGLITIRPKADEPAAEETTTTT